MFGTGEALELGCERRGCKRAGGQDGDGVVTVFVERGHLFTLDGDARVLFELLGDATRELDAINGERVAGGDGGGVGCCEEKGVGAAHLLLEQPGCGVFGLRLEGVGADEFGEVSGLVCLRGAERAHLGECDVAAEGCGLVCGFGTGESSADDVDLFHAG